MASKKAPTAPDETPKPKSLPSLWNCFRVRWEFISRLYGSCPADPAVIEAWIAARLGDRRPSPESRSPEDINEEVMASLEARAEEPQYSVLVFQANGPGLVMRYPTVRAHLKDCARVLSNQYIGKAKGERAFSTRVINGLYMDERQYWIPILRPDGSPVAKADGTVDKMVHAKGPMGQPINALKRIEFIEPPSVMEFTVKLLGNSVSETDLALIMQYGGVHGYAGERSEDGGKYDFSIRRIEAAAVA